MSANTPEFRTALTALSRNNANNSSTFNWYLAILEWAEWMVSHRETINNYLASLITDGDEKAKNIQALNWLWTLREKVAFIATLNNNWYSNEIISKICEEILIKMDLSESAVIRISALNRFSISLNSEQNIKLLEIETQLKDVIAKRVPDLLSNLNIKNENSSQRIQKIREITEYLIKNGLLEKYPEWYNDIINLLNPLVELDKTYHALNHARNNFYDIQRWYWEVRVLSSWESKILEQAVWLLTWLETTLDNFFQANISTRLEDINLESLLESILSKCSDAKEQLKALNISVWDFQKYFLYYFSTETLYKTKLSLDRKKSEVFKDRKKDFELDIKKWREIQRDRLLELYQQDWTDDEIEAIFERDRKLFIKTWNEEEDEDLQTALENILFKRYPNTPDNVLQDLAVAILDENQVTNELYYGNTNYFQNASQDTRWQQLVRSIWNTGRAIQAVWWFTTPIISWLVKFTQKSLEFSWKTISGIMNWTTSWVKWVVDNYNKWANTDATTFLWKVAKFPFKASQILTRPLWWSASWVGFVVWKTTWLVAWSYDWLNNVIKSASWEKIDGLFDVFSQIYKHWVNLLGQWTAWTWEKAFDMLKTEQKRQILSAFYESKSSSEVSALLEAIDMQSVLKDSSPYIFDYDYFDELWYDIKPENEEIVDNSSEEIKSLKSKVDEVLWDLEAKKSEDIQIYWEIIDAFGFIKRELSKDTDEKNKFKAVKAKINTLIQTLKSILQNDETKSSILRKLWLSKSEWWDFEINQNSFLWHLESTSNSINKTWTTKKQKFKDAVLSLSV